MLFGLVSIHECVSNCMQQVSPGKCTSQFYFPDFCSHNLVKEETAEYVKARYQYSSDIKCISLSPSIGIFFSFGMCCILSLHLTHTHTKLNCAVRHLLFNYMFEKLLVLHRQG
jgi:hypothetical protein